MSRGFSASARTETLVAATLTLLEEARPLYREFPEPWIELRLLWLEGVIARTLGALGEAESIFERLWQEFRARGSQHSLTLVSIDLAATYVDVMTEAVREHRGST